MEQGVWYSGEEFGFSMRGCLPDGKKGGLVGLIQLCTFKQTKFIHYLRNKKYFLFAELYEIIPKHENIFCDDDTKIKLQVPSAHSQGASLLQVGNILILLKEKCIDCLEIMCYSYS